MSERLDAALAFVLKWEGGYVNHPNDPGGATNKGVTQRTFDAWNLRQGKLRRSVLSITDDEVHAIYEADYWLAAHCDQLPAPLDLVTFDTAVNMGVGRAVRFLQHAVGEREDGEFGPLTREAVLSVDDPRGAALRFCDRRDAYYKTLAETNPRLGVFLRGWLNRLSALRLIVGHVGSYG